MATAYDTWKLGLNDPHFDSDFDPEEYGWKFIGTRKSGEHVFKKAHYGEWLIKTTDEVEEYERAKEESRGGW